MEDVKVRVVTELTVPMASAMFNSEIGSSLVDPQLQHEITMQAVSLAVRSKLAGFNGEIEVEKNYHQGQPLRAEETQPVARKSGGAAGGGTKHKDPKEKFDDASYVVSFKLEDLCEGVSALQQDYDRLLTIAQAMKDALPDTEAVVARKGAETAVGSNEAQETESTDVFAKGSKSTTDNNKESAPSTSTGTTEANFALLVSQLRDGLDAMLEVCDPMADRYTAPEAMGGGTKAVEEHPQQHDPEDSGPPGLVGDNEDSSSQGSEGGGYKSGFSRDYDPAEMGYAALVDDDNEDEDGGDYKCSYGDSTSESGGEG